MAKSEAQKQAARASKRAAKRRRLEYMRGVAVRQSRFDEMMAAVTGRATHPCVSCTLIYPTRALDGRGICGACRKSMARLATRPPEPRPSTLVSSRVEPNVVWVDASFRDGLAGLAVAGALGEHTRTVEARTSTQAETLALRWAMEIARSADRKGLTFRTDCESAYLALRQTRKREYWTVEQIPRGQNRRADRLAWDARLGKAL